MDIERINENTVKFYISYVDIENRGFEREEIWYNRERSEQLFWQMMDEANYKEDFNVEGPLWIQVQALEKGLEIIVTKAQIANNGESLEIPTEDGNSIDISVNEKVENLLEEKFGRNEESEEEIDDDGNFWLIVSFNDFEDVIQLSHDFANVSDELSETLYHFAEKYYLYMEFPDDLIDEDRQEDLISRVFEYADDTDVTIYYLQEYGKPIFENNAFAQIRSFFPAEL